LREAGYTAQILRKVGFSLQELVDGQYTATNLKHASYSAGELKEVGFSAGKLRVAGFTSKQLQAARYRLRDMQEGGFFWKDLVIFLRATHDELTKAGFEGLDPKHELFLTHRPSDDAGPNESVPETVLFSPRGGQGVQMLSPRPMPRVGTVEVAEKPLKLRQGVALTSKPIGVIAQGTKLRVVDSRVWSRDGTQRVCVASVESEESGVSILPLGWVTIQPPTLPHTRPSVWTSAPMPRVMPAPATNLTPVYAHGYARLHDESTAFDC